MSWFGTIVFLIFAIINICESKTHHHHHHHQKKKSSSAVVVGTVYCDTCFQQNLPKASQYFIAGASVVVECKDMGAGRSFRQQVKTDSHGEFRVHLPFPVSKHVRKIRGCSVRLISSNKPYCAVAASATSSNLHLKSTKGGARVFSAGFFTFRPQVCDEKPSNSKKLSQFSNPSDPAFVPPIQYPPSLGSFLPPLPRLPPLPQLPRLPPLPGIPFLPPLVPKQDGNNVPKLSENLPDFPFPPNPFNLPSLIFPPNPFQAPPITIPPILPAPLPPILPPLFPSPTLPPLLNLPPLPPLPPLLPLPPLPGLTPSPPPPAPLQLPPFPFQPSPGFPGAPHAQVSAPSEKKTP